MAEKDRLTDEELEALQKATDNLSGAYASEVYQTWRIRNHGLAREKIKAAYEQLKKIVEGAA